MKTPNIQGPTGPTGPTGSTGPFGGAQSIRYTFSTTTTDSDPGNGTLRLDNATQNTAATIRADLLDRGGTDWTSALNALDDSTSGAKGFIRLTKETDLTKWLLFYISGIVTAPSGYRNVGVTIVASSAASPFSDGDNIVLTFDRTGDKGDTGPVSGGSTTSTSTGNLDNVAFSNNRVLRMNNASLATIRGLDASSAVDGQCVTVVNIGSSTVMLNHQDTNSTAANRLINNVTSGPTPLAPNGSATYVYDITTARWRLAEHRQGGGLTRAFAAGNYTSSSGTWVVEAGDVSNERYIIIGNRMFLDFEYITTTITGTPNNLAISVPGGYTAAGTARVAYRALTGTLDQVTIAVCPVATSSILLYAQANTAANFQATTNLGYILGSMSIELT